MGTNALSAVKADQYTTICFCRCDNSCQRFWRGYRACTDARVHALRLRWSMLEAAYQQRIEELLCARAGVEKAAIKKGQMVPSLTETLLSTQGGTTRLLGRSRPLSPSATLGLTSTSGVKWAATGTLDTLGLFAIEEVKELMVITTHYSLREKQVGPSMIVPSCALAVTAP
jgi:hypothetical protein